MAIEIALVVNRKERREWLSALLAPAIVKGCATISQAEEMLCRHHFDGIIIDGYAYPGVGCSDPTLQLLEAELPQMEYSDHLVRWSIALQFIRLLREAGDVHESTPVLVMLGDLSEETFGVVDALTSKGVKQDLAGVAPATVVFGEGEESDRQMRAWARGLVSHVRR